MIDLYDAARLDTRRDHSLAMAGGALLLVAAVMLGQTWLTQSRLQALRAETAALEATRKGADTGAPQAARAAALDDLQRQAERLERLAGGEAADGTPTGAGLTPSQWMVRLAALTQPGMMLTRIDLERDGAVRLEGATRDAATLDAFLQAWQRHDDLVRVQARSIEARQDPQSGGPLLRFQLRAQAGGGR